ncbi:autotransporter outer membrane beta-barrel domain-containing protein [Neorhodopirellula lusitana]|uniref:hypothetical protein n=1 Tax=Neorhodopirellula lusitana TaxID=445327 RepID=UPI00384BB3CF
MNPRANDRHSPQRPSVQRVSWTLDRVVQSLIARLPERWLSQGTAVELGRLDELGSHQELAQVGSDQTCPTRKPIRRPAPKKPTRPTYGRRLEPRIVLNATAELLAMGDLVLSGDGFVDEVSANTLPNGDIQFIDANTGIIPIRVGEDAFGNPILVDSIDPGVVATGRLHVDLGAGDDQFSVDLPAELDLTVIDGGGTDSVDVTVGDHAGNLANLDLQITAETISLDASGQSLDLQSSELTADTSITIENAIDVNLGNVDVGSGTLTVGSTGQPLGGELTQAAGTSLTASQLDAWSVGDVELEQTANAIARIANLQSDGDVSIVSSQTMTVDALVADNIELVVVGDDSDLLIGSVEVSDPTVGDVRLTAGDDILGGNDELLADDLILRASNATDDGPDAIRLSTNVNDLDAIVAGNNAGDLTITEADSIRLASSDAASDAEVLQTGNGAIRVTAGGTISIDDSDSNNDGAGLVDDQEIIAGGDRGRIDFQAGDDFIAGDSVQLAAADTSAGAVTVSATQVVLGDDFEINTGDGVGVARRFGPRPDPDELQPTNPVLDPELGIETAFYDIDSVQTSILEQANANDAEGVLSVDIGVAGENGLTLSIDWGAATNRFEELTDLAGDRTRVDVAHVYTQSDILNSTLNGRTGATEPLAVRFAVSHHESIVITGDSIEQTIPDPMITSVSEPVPGGLVTSTDNPNTGSALTPVYESGRAFFVIPRIDVPVAFFPVRDVIPEPVTPPPPVQLTSVILLSDVDFETAEASASAITIREEYFQLRMLSPDPNGDDLIEPVRLPENVLQGDRLNDLFAGLPDGAYEIEYVIGDGDQRTILRVDLRGGQPKILSDDLDAGLLKLNWLEGESVDWNALEADALEGNLLDADESNSDEPRGNGADSDQDLSLPDDPSANADPRTGDASNPNAAAVESVLPVAAAASAIPVALVPFSRASRFWKRTSSQTSTGQNVPGECQP